MRILICVLALVVGFLAGARAAPPALIVVLLPGTSLHEWQRADAPNLHRLMQTGALAVMNTRTARLPNDHRRESPESALRTLGAGARATDSGRSGQSVGYDLHPGNLADTLASHGVLVHSGGGPAVALVAANGTGRVFPIGTLQAQPGACLIWDAGPSLAQADAVLSAAAAQVLLRRGRLIVLSPYANDHDYAEGHRLTPVLEWGPGVSAGLLYSSSTHRAGLVTNMDFAPTVAAYFGISRDGFQTRPFGAAWSAQPATASITQVARLEAQAVRQMSGMRLLPYLAGALAVWIVLCTWLLTRRRHWVLGPLLPIVALTAALVSVSVVSFGIVLCLLTVVMGLAAQQCGAARAAATLAVLTALLLTGDMVTGSRWMLHSLLGYSVIEGARYYGIGNEAMGVLIGTVLVTAAQFWPTHRRGQWVITAALAALSLLLGAVGAKAGGVLVSAAAFGTFLFRAWGGQWNVHTALTLGGIATAILAALALADAFLLPQSSSHIGEAVRRIVDGGWSEAADIIKRKILVEGRLAYHSAWALLLWGGLGSLVLLWRSRHEADSTASALTQAGLVGIGVSLIFNDAGVVAAALLIAVLWSDTAAQSQSALASVHTKARALKKPVADAY